MKCRIPTAQQRIAQDAERRMQEGITYAQWLFILALNRGLGLGEDRILRVLDAYFELVKEFEEFKEDDVHNEMLSQAVKQIMPNSFERLFPER